MIVTTASPLSTTATVSPEPALIVLSTEPSAVVTTASPLSTTATVSPEPALIVLSTEPSAVVTTTPSLSTTPTASPTTDGGSNTLGTLPLDKGFIKTVAEEIIIVPSAFFSLRDRLVGSSD